MTTHTEEAPPRERINELVAHRGRDGSHTRHQRSEAVAEAAWEPVPAPKSLVAFEVLPEHAAPPSTW